MALLYEILFFVIFVLILDIIIIFHTTLSSSICRSFRAGRGIPSIRANPQGIPRSARNGRRRLSSFPLLRNPITLFGG